MKILLIFVIICGVNTIQIWSYQDDKPKSPPPPIIYFGKLGESCESLGVQCNTTFSECIENICKCKSGYVQKPGSTDVCLKSVDDPIQVCYFNAQCEGFYGPHSACQNYECRCKNTSNLPTGRCSEEKTKILIGQPCSKGTSDCAGAELKRFDGGCSLSGICSCPRGYITSSGLDFCLQNIDQVGERCWEDQQCQQGSVGRLSGCFGDEFGERFCNCTKNAVLSLIENKCVLVADGEYNIDCSVQDQCTVKMGHSQCLDGKCVCLKGKKRSWNGICE